VKSCGFLAMLETNVWLDATLDRFTEHGFDHYHRLPLPPGVWWSHYYGPLEERVLRVKERNRGPMDREALKRYEREIREVKADIGKTDCSFLIVQLRDR